MFLMGCQSLCRVTELPCRRGVVRFVQKESEVCVHPQHEYLNVRFVASRVGGKDDMLEALFSIVWNDEELHQGRLEWLDGDVSPKTMDVPVYLRSHVFSGAKQMYGGGSLAGGDDGSHSDQGLHARAESDSDMSAIAVGRAGLHANITCRIDVAESLNSRTMVDGPVLSEAYAVQALLKVRLSESCAPPSAGEIVAQRTHYEVREDLPYVDIVAVRRGGGQGAASVDIIFAGGSAIPHIDFSPPSLTKHRLAWAAGEDGPRSFRLALRDSVEHESRMKSAYFLLANAQGGILSSHHSLISLVIRDVTPAASASSANNPPLSSEEFILERLHVLPFANLISDRLVQERFLRSWQHLPLRRGEIFMHEGHIPMFVTVVLRGVVRLTCNCRYEDYLKNVRLDSGAIIGASNALSLRPTEVSAVAETDVDLLVMPVHILRLHASLVHEVSILDVIRRASFKSVIKNSPKKHPIVLFPGFMSSRLSAWKSKPCMGMNIEVMEPLWISIERIMQTLSVDKSCWLGCLALGLNQTDQDDCKIRPREGISAVSELYPGPFRGPTTIFRSIIEYLATEWGYDANSLVSMPYDWRLSPDKLEERDMFFTKAKASIELAYKQHGLPAVLISHSLGGMIVNYFFEWLKRSDPDWEAWSRKHIQASIGLGIPLLGSSSTLFALLHGDTMGLPITAAQAREFGMTFGSGLWLLPVPGPPGLVPPVGQRIRMRPDEQNSTGWEHFRCHIVFPNATSQAYTVEEVHSGHAFEEIAVYAKDEFAERSLQLLRHYQQLEHNPLASPPARPPIETVIMIYGVDRPTKASMVFQKMEGGDLRMTETLHEGPGGVLMAPNGTVVGNTSMPRSGDGSVQYASLSWAHAWHLSEKVEELTTPAQEVEFYEHLLGQWGERSVFSLLNTQHPASTRFESEKDNKHTVVIEVDGQEHRDTVRNPFVVNNLLERELLHIWGRGIGLSRPGMPEEDANWDDVLAFYQLGLFTEENSPS